ncbi:MAG: radical SAM protein [Candidatus Mariimomonas ferrooxydans]
MILIHPPVAKPCEPPAGVAKLSGALAGHGIKHTILDANLEALLYIISNTHSQAHKQYDKWTVRSLRNISENHESIKSRRIFQNIDRYKRTVIDLNHAIELWADKGASPGIANYRHKHLSPLRSDDLILAAEHPEENPYYPYFSKRLPTLVERNTSTVAGFSLNYLSQALCAFAMAGFLKQHFPGLSIVLGGGLVTSWMRNPDWQNPFRGLIDHLVAGPGERKLLAILGVDDIKEEHSSPDYGLLPLDDYLAPGRILPYSASSGCYWNKCSFCPEKAENNPYVPVPVDTAINDLNKLIRQTEPLLVHLLDNAISRSLLKRLANNAGGVPWYGFARISRLLTDIDFCMGLKKSGCVMLKLGLESGDQGVLDKMHKGIDIETASLALKTLKKAGIAAYVYLIFGTPAETLPAARKTLEFVVRHKDEIGFLNVALFNMPVCGLEASRFETSSFYEGDLSLYTDFSHPTGWNRKDVRLFLNNEFKKHRAVSEILKKDPPVFTSNHAAFFVM